MGTPRRRATSPPTSLWTRASPSRSSPERSSGRCSGPGRTSQSGSPSSPSLRSSGRTAKCGREARNGRDGDGVPRPPTTFFQSLKSKHSFFQQQRTASRGGGGQDVLFPKKKIVEIDKSLREESSLTPCRAARERHLKKAMCRFPNAMFILVYEGFSLLSGFFSFFSLLTSLAFLSQSSMTNSSFFSLISVKVDTSPPLFSFPSSR